MSEMLIRATKAAREAAFSHYGNDRFETVARSVIEVTGWQDISTAPKDGPVILVYDPTEFERNLIMIVTWDYDGWCEWTGAQFHYVAQPTHWMPLQTPPEKPQESADALRSR